MTLLTVTYGDLYMALVAIFYGVEAVLVSVHCLLCHMEVRVLSTCCDRPAAANPLPDEAAGLPHRLQLSSPHHHLPPAPPG